jgi:hypothetical protein
MQYREIVSVTGIGGLFQMVGSKKDGAIVRSLQDNTTRFISARLHNVTPLESVEIFTTGDNVRLHEVLKAIQDSQTELPDVKTAGNEEIKDYFLSVYPDLDDERVYVSDMKKMLKWYVILKERGLLVFDEEEQPVEDGATDELLGSGEQEDTIVETEETVEQSEGEVEEQETEEEQADIVSEDNGKNPDVEEPNADEKEA